MAAPTIYRYAPDPNRFEALEPKSPKDLRTSNRFYKSKPMAKNWKPFEVKRWAGRVGDFPSLYGFIPVFSQRAWDVLGPLLADVVEALPIKHPSGKAYYAINVLQVVDCLDRKRSQLEFSSSGKVMGVEKYVFDPKRLPPFHMFKIPESSDLEVLSRTRSSRLSNPRS